jgi:hypothetical protein
LLHTEVLALQSAATVMDPWHPELSPLFDGDSAISGRDPKRSREIAELWALYATLQAASGRDARS